MTADDEYMELLQEAMALGWDPPPNRGYATDAVIFTFGRFQGHPDPSGATELTAHGPNEVEAMRNAVTQMNTQAGTAPAS